MRKFFVAIIATLTLTLHVTAQYADLGTGTLKNQIWWFDWNGFSIANGASRTFNTADGLRVTITFSSVTGPVCTPNVMQTWYGAVLHFLYDFSNPNVKPTLHTPYTTQNTQFTINITATRNGQPAAFKFVAADAEASAISETIQLQTTGTPWTTIDFFRNSSQSSNPFIGCNTNSATLTDTYGGSEGNGQNPVIGTDALTGSLNVNTLFTRNNIEGQSAVAFGIFAAIDRGDHPPTYGTAHHNLLYTSQQPCNFVAPFPTLVQSNSLKLGVVAGDPDGFESFDDNATGVDEDGLTLIPNYLNTGNYSLSLHLQNTTGSPAYLSGWLDIDRNGTFEVTERVSVVVPNNATTASLTWTGLPTTLPSGLATAHAFRFRLSSDQTSVQQPDGFSPDGEVEDYVRNINPNSVQANFLAQDTICEDVPLDIQNLTQGASSYYWNFCSGSLDLNPMETIIPSAQFSQPAFSEIVVNDEGEIFVFVVNTTGSLVRMAYGNSLMNPAVIANLGNAGGVIPPDARGIDVQKDGNSWIGYMLAGSGSNSRLIKLNFGSSLINPPIATNLGNLGLLLNAMDIVLALDQSNWYGFVTNAGNNELIRLDFGSTLHNTPVAQSLGNPGGLNFPVGLSLIMEASEYYLFIANQNANWYSRISFGTTLANTPGGHVYNSIPHIQSPRGITILRDCGKLYAFVSNTTNNRIVRLDFNNGILSQPTSSLLPVIPSLNSVGSLSDVVRIGDAVSFLCTNENGNNLTRINFNNCTSSSIPSFNGANPPPVTYTEPGIYNISLFVDEGLPTQTVYCKTVVVLESPEADFEFDIDKCNPLTVTFNSTFSGGTNPTWTFGDNSSTSAANTTHTYAEPGVYDIVFTVENENCITIVNKKIDIRILTENIVLTTDTTICFGTIKQILTAPALDFCWFPTQYLDDPNSPNPITSTTENITYYFIAKTTGDNLIVNGNFSAGNTGFNSEYAFLPGSGVDPGKYNVGSNITAWHPGMAPCGDHTTGTGNMLMVNGAGVQGVEVWSQTINIQPNTTYAFAAWLQHITSVNPARLQFSINGTPIGSIFQANNTSCVWERFYEVWYSGANTTAVISIVNQHTEEWGNDFALDDILFAPLMIKRDSVIISVDKPEINTIADTSICVGSPLILATTGANTYSWTPPNNLSDPTLANPIATPTSTTEYFVTGTTANGCTAKDSVTVNIFPELPYTITPDTTICSNIPLQLLVTGGTTYTWSDDPTLSNINIPNPIATPASSNIYYVAIQDENECVIIDSVKVDLRPDPIFTISPNGTICDRDSITISASGGDVYSWWPSLAIIDHLTSSPTVFPSITTDYIVTITDTVCNNTVDLTTTITVNSLPEIIAQKSNDIDCTDGFAQLEASGGISYEWSPDDGLNNPLIRNPIASPLVNTEYVVKGTDANGCENNAAVVVEVTLGNKISFFMPNAFTPNNDGLNDCYGIKYPGLTDKFELSIYNRWGERIFYTKNPADCWNGRYKGVAQDIGVYVFMVKSDGPCGSRFEKGLFTLIR